MEEKECLFNFLKILKEMGKYKFNPIRTDLTSITPSTLGLSKINCYNSSCWQIPNLPLKFSNWFAFFNHLIGSSSAGFTELILTGERVEAGIKSGKIQKDASASTAIKKTFPTKKEVSDRKSVV